MMFFKNTIKQIFLIKLRGFRSIRLYRCVLLICCLFCLPIVMVVNSIANTYIVYYHFIETYPFSTVSFWEDNRTLSQEVLLPVFTVDKVDLSNATIAITACCRNVKRHLKGLQRNLAMISALFGHYRIYFCESDSSDGTLGLLREWEKNDSNHVRVHSEGEQSWRVFSRTVRLASCRNYLLQQARAELPSLDYYFVIDVDVGSSSSFDVKDFLTNFLYPRSSWIAMTATQRSEYYDIWALRLPSILPFDCWTRIIQLTGIVINRSYLTERIVHIHQKPIPRNRSLIEVQSAFGGAALYNGRYLDPRCSYNGTVGDGFWNSYEQCEHVAFHQCLREHAVEQKIYINPQFQIC